ncbi:GNAT family N-acetyltransferase, partial [Clostridium sp. ZBS3]|uniref:GNAT family N-acetyltransferase n=1 Tax=Clostridium sp. ZBS3 TaxID=2949975 RepID=UPI00207A327F
TDDQNYNEELFSYLKTASVETETRFTLFTSSEEWEMMFEERFSNTLRNSPRMKFQRVACEGCKFDCNKSTYEVKRID